MRWIKRIKKTCNRYGGGYFILPFILIISTSIYGLALVGSIHHNDTSKKIILGSTAKSHDEWYKLEKTVDRVVELSKQANARSARVAMQAFEDGVWAQQNNKVDKARQIYREWAFKLGATEFEDGIEMHSRQSGKI